MADNKREKLPVHRTPKGTAVYPYLNTPDTKWKAEGEFKVKLIIEGKVEKLRKVIDEALAKAEAEAIEKAKEATKKTKKKVEAKQSDLPIFDEVDEEGEETGNTVMSFKSTASGTNKKTGKKWERIIPLFDAKMGAMRKDVFGGSTLIVAFSASPWVNPKCEYGVKLQIEAVQVIDLVSTGGQRSAGQYGFGEEEGYADDGETPSEMPGEDDAAPADNDGADDQF